MKKQYFLLFFLLIFFAFPAIVTDAQCTEYARLKNYYTWMTPKRLGIILFYAHKHNIEVDKICGLIQEESWGNSTAISCTGARGLMQIMPKYHYSHGNPENLNRDDALNISTGVRVLSKYMYAAKRLYGKNYHSETYRFYNAGPFSSRKNYQNWAYVNRILKNIKITRKIKFIVTIL